jgi:hypothetical protein
VVLTTTLTVDSTINETHSITLRLSMPGNPGSTPTFSVLLTSQSGDQPPSTSNLDAIWFCGAFGEVPLLTGATTYDIPDPNFALNELGGVLTSAALNLTFDTAYPPIPANGEDYIPIMD